MLILSSNAAMALSCIGRFTTNVDNVPVVAPNVELMGWNPGFEEEFGDDLVEVVLTDPDLEQTSLEWTKTDLAHAFTLPPMQAGFHIMEIKKNPDWGRLLAFEVDPDLVVLPPDPPEITSVSKREVGFWEENQMIFVRVDELEPGVRLELETTTAPTFDGAMRTALQHGSARISHARGACGAPVTAKHEVSARTRARVRTVNLVGETSDWVEVVQPAQGCSTASTWPDLFNLLKRR